MITTTQAKQYLASVGIEMPDFLLEALVEQANSIQECLDANGYTAAQALLLQTYLLGLLALGQGDRYISSQSAPSGASRSFRYQSFADRWRAGLSLLRGIDKHGCATALIPPNPTKTASGGIWVGNGGCTQ